MNNWSKDLLAASRYLLEDGHSMEAPEAVRIGISLAELAGRLAQAEGEVFPQSREQKKK